VDIVQPAGGRLAAGHAAATNQRRKERRETVVMPTRTADPAVTAPGF